MVRTDVRRPRPRRAGAPCRHRPRCGTLVAEWYVETVQRLLRRGLVRDCTEVRDEVPAARGTLQPLETAMAFHAGRLGLMCKFDEFGLDTPLNRVLRQCWPQSRQARTCGCPCAHPRDVYCGACMMSAHSRRRIGWYRRTLSS